MTFAFSALFWQSPCNSNLSKFKKGFCNFISKPDSTNKGENNDDEYKWPNKVGQNEKLKKDQQHKADNHTVHFPAGSDNQSCRAHNNLPFLDSTITPLPSFASNSLG